MTPRAQPATLVLLGLRGSGKSTLGHALARRLERAFVDLDDLTAEALHASSAGEAINEHGLAVFREAEARALTDALAHEHGGVLSLGGGTPTAPGAEQQLEQARAAGRIAMVYLRATPETLAARLTQTDPASRPSITGKGTLDEIGEVYAQRDDLYRELAQTTLDSDGQTIGETLDLLVSWSERAVG